MNSRNYFLFLVLLLFSVDAHAWQDDERIAQEEEWLRLIRKADEYSTAAKYDSALIISQNIALAAERESNYEFITRAYFTMAGVHYRINKMDLASEVYQKARRTAELWGNKSFVARADLAKGIVYDNLAGSALDRNSENYDSIKAFAFLDSALIFYDKSRKYYQENTPDNYLMLATVANNYAANYDFRKEYLKSIEERRQTIKLYRQAGYATYEIDNIKALGETYLFQYEANLSYLDSAQKYLTEALVLGTEKEMTEVALAASEKLARINQYVGDEKNSNLYRINVDSLLEEIYSRNYDDKVLELRAQYQTASAELEAEQAKSRALSLERDRRVTFIVAAAILVILFIWLYLLDQKRKNIKAIAAKNDELNKQRIDELLQEQEIASLQGVLEGQEQERKRVAIDLHDRLGGILSMVKLHFSAVEEKLPEDNPEKKKFLTASELLDLAAGEVRNISHNLLSGVLAKFGLLPALKDLTDRINESGEIKLNLIHHNVENALDGEQELQLYRIVQELISNILKHADAKEATIQLIRNKDEKIVNLIVEDDGKGFDPSTPSPSSGIGLSNLKVRVNKLQGSFHIDSGKGVGTSVSVNIPVEND